MSRIGTLPITIPENVTVELSGDTIKIKGPKGELTQSIHNLIKLSQEDSTLTLKRKNDTKHAKSLHGTFQRLISNMIVGVTDGFEKQLELVGTGYRAAKKGNSISLSLGFSHQIDFPIPENVTVELEGNNKIKVTGIDKQYVGQIAAQIRAFRTPEPYKGKGIRYQGEHVRRKAGKAAKAAEA